MDKEINTNVYDKINFPLRKKSEKPGFYLKKHYTEYVETVKELKRAGKLEKAEQLLLNLIDAVEAESKTKKVEVAPWYYEQLAIIYRKQKALQKELKVLERFTKQRIGPGALPPKLFKRLEKIRTMLETNNIQRNS